MWLLDVNVPVQILKILEESGIKVSRSDRMGWARKTNGELTAAAASEGFVCLLTRDRLFSVSAAGVLKDYPNFCIVLLTLSQAKSLDYVKDFEQAWERCPIQLTPGAIVLWRYFRKLWIIKR